MKSNKQKEDKVILHKFNCDLYDYDLFITVSNNEAAINKLFLHSDDTIITDFSTYNSSAFVLSSIKFKKTKRDCILIVFKDKKYMDMNTVAHECFHVAQAMANVLGLIFSNDGTHDEHMAYLIGWAADCCEQVKRNKFKYEGALQQI